MAIGTALHASPEVGTGCRGTAFTMARARVAVRQ